MNETAPLSLSQDHRLLLARACSTFPGEKLNEVIARALQIFPTTGFLSTFTKSVERMFQGLSMLCSSYKTRAQRAGTAQVH